MTSLTFALSLRGHIHSRDQSDQKYLDSISNSFVHVLQTRIFLFWLWLNFVHFLQKHYKCFTKHFGRTDRCTYRPTDRRTENLPILQDFVPYQGRCPAATNITKKINNNGWIKSRARELLTIWCPGATGFRCVLASPWGIKGECPSNGPSVRW